MRTSRPIHGAIRRLALALALAGLGVTASGCVTVAEHRKLEARLMDLERGAGRGADPREQVADVSAEIEVLRSQLRTLQGRLEVAEKTAANALAESSKARRAAARLSAGELPPGIDAGEDPDATPEEGDAPEEEVQAYRAAYATWRAGDLDACIDQFRKFLQTHPSSIYADDAAFWMADCHFKQGDYRNAVLRFDDVVRNYPEGNKASDALFRQGESLLKLGPNFHSAARRAFDRVLKEYPDSARVEESRRHLEALGSS